MQLKIIDKKDLEPLVRISYQYDFEGMERFHVEPFLDYETSVRKTLKMIAEVEREIPMRYYEVEHEGNQIGYVTLSDELLYSFCISKKYRGKKGVLKEWWELVKKEMSDTFICILQPNNTRAINFLKKSGMKEIDTHLEHLITLSCQQQYH